MLMSYCPNSTNYFHACSYRLPSDACTLHWEEEEEEGKWLEPQAQENKQTGPTTASTTTAT